MIDAIRVLLHLKETARPKHTGAGTLMFRQASDCDSAFREAEFPAEDMVLFNYSFGIDANAGGIAFSVLPVICCLFYSHLLLAEVVRFKVTRPHAYYNGFHGRLSYTLYHLCFGSMRLLKLQNVVDGNFKKGSHI